MNATPATEAVPVCDFSQRFVRVRGYRDNGFVEFEFSIGWPELFVELMLPEPAFETFCQEHNVRRLDGWPRTTQETKPT